MSCGVVVQQAVQQIRNISTCQDVVQQIDTYNKSTTKSRTNQQVEQLYNKSVTFHN